MFSKALWVAMLLFVSGFLGVKAQLATSDSASVVAGKWVGSFDGAVSGKFELVLNQNGNRKLTGQVIMLADDGNRYPIDLKTVAWENGKLVAAYVNPQDSGEVNFTGSYVSSQLKGTWTADGGQQTGTWQVTRPSR